MPLSVSSLLPYTTAIAVLALGAALAAQREIAQRHVFVSVTDAKRRSRSRASRRPTSSCARTTSRVRSSRVGAGAAAEHIWPCSSTTPNEAQTRPDRAAREPDGVRRSSMTTLPTPPVDDADDVRRAADAPSSISRRATSRSRTACSALPAARRRLLPPRRHRRNDRGACARRRRSGRSSSRSSSTPVPEFSDRTPHANVDDALERGRRVALDDRASAHTGTARHGGPRARERHRRRHDAGAAA